jgi:hypothetical protein
MMRVALSWQALTIHGPKKWSCKDCAGDSIGRQAMTSRQV